MSEPERRKPTLIQWDSGSAPRQLDPGWIRDQFTLIAPHYDRLNCWLSLGLQGLWRRQLLALAPPPPHDLVLDLCAGTGELSRLWLRRFPDTRRVLLADFTEAMLRLAPPKLDEQRAWLVCGDALRLPLPDGCCDVVLCGFSLRNLADWRAGLTEIFRVLRPGGTALILELCREKWPGPVRAFVLHAVPWLGRVLSGESEAYAWLPRSIASFVPATEVAAALREVGFVEVRARSSRWRLCTAFSGRKL